MSTDLTTRFHESSFKRHFIMIRFALALLAMLDMQLASVPKTKSARNLPTFTPFLGGGVVTSGKSWTRCAEACQARGRATFSHHDERVSRSVFSRPVIQVPNHRRRRDTVCRNSSLSCVCMEFSPNACDNGSAAVRKWAKSTATPVKCG